MQCHRDQGIMSFIEISGMRIPADQAAAMLLQNLRFLRMGDVEEWVGLSRSEIYRRQKDTDPATNPFPKPHHYQQDDKKGSFYLSTDIRAWQLRELGIEPTPAPSVGALLG